MMPTENAHTMRSRYRSGADRTRVPESVLATLVIVALFAAAWLSGGSVSQPTVTTQSVRVVKGDTLWTLAERYPANGYSTAETVDLLVQMNDLDSPVIAENMVLSVPVDSSPVGAQVALAQLDTSN